MSDRIYYLDYAKAIGIIMIMMAHTFMWSQSTLPVCYVVCSIHVPIFFFVSGILKAVHPTKLDFITFVKKGQKLYWFLTFGLVYSMLVKQYLHLR